MFKTLLEILAIIAVGAVIAFFLTFFLIVFAIIVGCGLLLLLYWSIIGVPFQLKHGDKVVAEYRRFRRVK
jgi:hypothetical protein